MHWISERTHDLSEARSDRARSLALALDSCSDQILQLGRFLNMCTLAYTFKHILIRKGDHSCTRVLLSEPRCGSGRHGVGYDVLNPGSDS